MRRIFIILLCLSCAFPLIAQRSGRSIIKATETVVKGIPGNIVAGQLFDRYISSNIVERAILNAARHQAVYVRPTQREFVVKEMLKDIQKERIIFREELRKSNQIGNFSILLPDNPNLYMPPSPLKKNIKKEEKYKWSDWDKEWINLILQEIERVFPMKIDESEYDLDWVRIKVLHDGTVFEWSA